jgi:hypothetical protein
MKMSRRRPSLEGGPVAQHRPHDVDPPAGEGDQCLSVLLALSPLAIVEGPGLWRATQACERRLVKDSFEKLVAAAPRKRWLPTRLPESWAAGTSPA